MNTTAKLNPWLFADDAVFPVVGDTHPLKKFHRKLLYRGSITAVSIHLAVFGGWLIGRNIKASAPPPAITIDIKRVAPTDLGVPPSIAQEVDASAVQVAAQVAPPSIGVPEPVPDFQATTTTLATTDQLAEALTPVDLSQMGQGSDSIVVDESAFEDQNPSPDEFVAVEEQPVPIQTPAPVYPEMARSAEVEGVVMVRALVSKEGKVENAFVVEGQPMLNDAAIAAVKRWTFRPALQQHKPVKVWVQIPIRFSLH